MRISTLGALTGVTLLSACSTVPSGPALPGYIDTAEVIKADPLYKRVEVARPVNECWTEQVPATYRARGSHAGPLVGGIVGGLVGSRLTHGRGKTPLTVAGALVGASLGQRLSAAPYRPPAMTSVRRCQTVNRYQPRQQIVGYRVDYRYEGQTFTTQTYRHPGRFIRLRVNVDPVDGT
jgi:uncharacterized protein YcfJ